MRWLGEDGKPIATPDVFIPLAEEAGLIQTTTWYSLSNSLRMSADCGGLPVAVNITPRMLHDREFVDMIRSSVSMWGIKPRQLTLEVTEGGLIADFVQATARLKKLRDMGLRVSIDDFGTGYSSLSHLQRFPVDSLKIDRSFLMQISENPEGETLIRTLIRLGKALSIETLAEGIEDAAQLTMLRDEQCDNGQGFLFARPLEAQDAERFLRDWRPADGERLQLAAFAAEPASDLDA
jgi:EAL domain-containing protein (putative c-di-GMP-specific phosphodiesterase class I)